MFYRNTELTGADEATLTDHRRRHVAFVFQFYNLIPSLTARENIALVTEISDNPMLPLDAGRPADRDSAPRRTHRSLKDSSQGGRLCCTPPTRCATVDESGSAALRSNAAATIAPPRHLSTVPEIRDNRVAALECLCECDVTSFG